MSNKEKLEKDYKKFNQAIENEAENELKKIQQESNELKEEVNKISETVEPTPKEKETKSIKKKVNT